MHVRSPSRGQHMITVALSSSGAIIQRRDPKAESETDLTETTATDRNPSGSQVINRHIIVPERLMLM